MDERNFDMTMAMFKRVGFKTNPEKTKSMVCTPGYTWGNWSKEAYIHHMKGGGDVHGEKVDKGQLHIVWCGGVGVIPELTHGEETWRQCTPYKGR